MHKVMPREYLQCVKNLLLLLKMTPSSCRIMCLNEPSRYDVEGFENGGTLSDRGKPAERSMEDLTKSPGSSHSYGMSRAARALTVRSEAPDNIWHERSFCCKTYK